MDFFRLGQGLLRRNYHDDDGAVSHLPDALPNLWWIPIGPALCSDPPLFMILSATPKLMRRIRNGSMIPLMMLVHMIVLFNVDTPKPPHAMTGIPHIGMFRPSECYIH